MAVPLGRNPETFEGFGFMSRSGMTTWMISWREFAKCLHTTDRKETSIPVSRAKLLGLSYGHFGPGIFPQTAVLQESIILQGEIHHE